MKVLKELKYYILPRRNYYRISSKFEYLPNKLIALNKRREELQSKISELTCNNICMHCKNNCCELDCGPFTYVDYILRKFSDKPIGDYGFTVKPNNIFFDAKEYVSRRKNNRKVTDDIDYPKPIGQCSHLNSDGCGLAPKDRAILCALWTCKDMRDTMDKSTFKKIGKLNKELVNVGKKALKLIK